MKKKAGFTLVEIMIVVAIIGLLAAIAIPSFVKARNTARTNACINNLRQVDGAKQQLALASNLLETVTPSNEELAVYINGGFPTCPGGGTYTAGPIASNPVCSLVDLGHVLP